MSLPYEGEAAGSDVKIIESKTVCYCSNFDLNVNEWFNEFENIEIFKLNMKKNLGKSLHCNFIWQPIIPAKDIIYYHLVN